MAKAADVPGLEPGTPFALAAARAVRVRAEELFAHGDDVLDTQDIERVHDMRVATRRLRAVLEVFAACFPPELFKPALRDVKRLADALGARRDPDVQLDALGRVAGEVGEAERPGVEAFAVVVRAEQGAGNEELAAALQDARESDLRGRLAALADAAEERAGADGPLEGREDAGASQDAADALEDAA
jgi:CHAD domain-containing protein